MNELSEELVEKVLAYKQGEMVSLMIHLGMRLGLYEAMAGKGDVGVDSLAAETGLHRRWLLEWLRQQTAAGILRHHTEESFELPDEAAPLFLDDSSVLYVGGFFHPPLGGKAVDRIAKCFETGIGMTWDDHGHVGTHLVAGSTKPQHLLLVSQVLPLMDGMVTKLEEGISAVDVGCGSGVAVTELAAAFPKSSFLGIDPSPTALAQARALIAERGLTNVEVREGSAETLEGDFGFVMVLDVMHDMTHPHDAMAAVRRSLGDDGSWLVKDIRSAATLTGNLENPLAALLYGFSIAFCMSSALSKEGGAGLGTLGFSSETAEAMAKQAGFTRFRMLDYEDDPFNAYYEIRL